MITKHGVKIMTTARVRTGTRLAVSLHQRNTAVGETGITMTCMTSSIAEMHNIGSRTSVRSVSALIRSNVKRGTMIIMVPIMINLTDNALPREDAMREESRPFPLI
jgi:hypothetical protein